ncbi:MAG: hypothetical protein AB1758_21870, partial [Candidatus Eremiobacterota bacterium]
SGLDGTTDSGVAFQVGVRSGASFTPSFSIVFGANGQPVNGLGGGTAVLQSAAVITVGTHRRAVNLEVQPTGAVRSSNASPNPF